MVPGHVCLGQPARPVVDVVRRVRAGIRAVEGLVDDRARGRTATFETTSLPSLVFHPSERSRAPLSLVIDASDVPLP
jgi:hypothetical protein